jgi:predicted Rossmann fold nucleotide-binding protein DprA/Smf involved in DNA uptake
MKLTITIQLDEDSSQLIKTTLMNLSKRINDLTDDFEKIDSSFEESTDIDPKPVTVPAKPAAKKRPKPRKSNLTAVLKTIKKHKDGINFKELQKETGLTGKQISDNAYRLKKENKIKKTEKGMFVAV